MTATATRPDDRLDAAFEVAQCYTLLNVALAELARLLDAARPRDDVREQLNAAWTYRAALIHAAAALPTTVYRRWWQERIWAIEARLHYLRRRVDALG